VPEERICYIFDLDSREGDDDDDDDSEDRYSVDSKFELHRQLDAVYQVSACSKLPCTSAFN